MASHERSDAKEDQGFPTNVLFYDAPALADQRGKFEREITHSGTEIHHDTAFTEIQRLDHVGGALPMVALAFDLVQRMESVSALVKIAQQENQQHSADQEQSYPNTICLLDPAGSGIMCVRAIISHKFSNNRARK